LYDNLASRLYTEFRARFNFYDLQLYVDVSDYHSYNLVC